MRFSSKVVVITGAASGIGRATVELFAEEGATVVALDVDKAAGTQEAARLTSNGHNVEFYRGSVADETDVSSLFKHLADTHGRVDILYNNAGIFRTGEALTTTLDDWRRVLAVNLDGVFLMSKHAIPLMIAAGGGAIVNTSSISGHVANEGGASYIASKHAVEGLTKALALEHARHGIRVNTVCPGYVNTPMGRADLELDPSIPDLHPLGRIAEPEEIAAGVAFLASDQASFITGTSLMIDGGYTAM